MPTKYLDLSDLSEDNLEVTLPFKDNTGEVKLKKCIIKDPSVASVLVAERLREEIAKMKDNDDIGVQKKFLQMQVYELLRIDNEVTREQVDTLPFTAIVKLSNWVTKHIESVFLEDSPKSSTSDSSPVKSDEKVSESPSTTPSSATVSS